MAGQQAMDIVLPIEDDVVQTVAVPAIALKELVVEVKRMKQDTGDMKENTEEMKGTLDKSLDKHTFTEKKG